MKFNKVFAVLALSALPFAAQAGEEVKEIVPVIEPAPAFGVGSYWALQGGINAYQSYEGSERRQGYTLEVNEKIGGFGGLKVGHVFGDGGVRQALELDAFYNGADFAVDLRDGGDKLGSYTGRFDTGAVLVNYIIRFDLNAFQPYVGAGIGGWFGQTSDARIATSSGKDSVRIHNGGDSTDGSWAWQVVAGADYFINPGFSVFTEYKWLNYQDAEFGAANDRVAQHLVGVGLRWFF